MREKVNATKVNQYVEVASVGYRLMHLLNLVLITLLAITGSMLLFPNIMNWLSYAMGVSMAVSGLGTPYPVSAGLELARSLHRFFGMIWGISFIIYGVYLLAFRKVRLFDALKHPLSQQMREARALFEMYVFGKPIPEDVAKNLERHNVLVAYMSLILIIGLVFLSISGVLMVYREFLDITAAEYRVLLLLHDIGFYLVLLFLYVHLYASFHPANRPLLTAMFSDGKVALEWVKEHMAGWYQKYVERGDY